MLKRTITGAFITVAVYLVLYFSYIPEVILVATALLSAFAVYEIYHAAGVGGNEVLFTLSIVAATLVVFGDIKHDTEIITAAFTLSVLTSILFMMLQKQVKLNSPIIALYLVALTVLMIYAIPILRNQDNGLYYLTGAVTLCFVTDIAAYLFGRVLGRHKIAPKISPNKTVEGSIAGVVLGSLVFIVIALCLDAAEVMAFDHMKLCIYAVITCIVGEFGDLAMSVIKRICRVKDFGILLPGHGGVLDRFDSHIFAVAFTLIFCHITGGFIL